MSHNSEHRLGRNSSAAAAIGMVTVGFAAGLYVPPADAEVEWYTPYFSGGGMVFCVCEQTEKVCAPCGGS